MAGASFDIVLVRTAVAWLSVLFLPLTWLLARRMLPGARTAQVAATALVTVSVLHLLFSQQARMHGPQASMALAAVLAAMRMRARPGVGSYLVGALCAGLAFGFLHNGAAAILPLLVAHLLRRRDTGTPPLFSLWGAALLFVPLMLVFLLFHPSPPTLQGQGEVLEFGGHTLPLVKLDGSGFVLVVGYLWDYEPALLIASLVGLVAGICALFVRRSRARVAAAAQHAGPPWQDVVIAAAYALPYLAAVGLMGLTQDRFLIPLLPFLACLAAWPVALLGEGRRGLATALSLALLAFPTFVTAEYVRLRSNRDTIEQAADWVRASVSPDARILTSARLTLPLPHSAEALRVAKEDYASRQTLWLGWQLGALPLDDAPFPGPHRWNLFVTPGKLLNMNRERGRADLEAWLERADAEVAVLEVSRLMAFIPQAALLRDVIAERGELVEVLAGEDRRWATERPLDYQEVPRFVPRILAATAFGPRVEIYRLKP